MPPGVARDDAGLAAVLTEADERLHVPPPVIHPYPPWNAVLPAARTSLAEFSDLARKRLA